MLVRIAKNRQHEFHRESQCMIAVLRRSHGGPIRERARP